VVAVWLVRAGAHAEYESKFIAESGVYATWHDLDVDVSKLPNRAALVSAMTERYPDTNPKAITNWSSQVWRFAHEITAGDLIVLPIRRQRGPSRSAK